MRIAIDGQLLSGHRTGMGVYIFNIIKNWDETIDELVVFIPGNPSIDITHIAQEKRFKLVILKTCNYFMWEQIVLPRVVKKYCVDFIICPYCTAPILSNIPTLLVLHDTIFMETKILSVSTIYKKMGVLYRRMIVPLAARKAKLVITVSAYSKNQITKYFPFTKTKIFVIPNGIEDSEGLSDQDRSIFFNSTKIVKNYILGFGSLETRKNTLATIRAYELLDDRLKEQYQLVLFGFRGYEKSKEKKYIESHGLSKKIVVLQYVTDKEKKTLYDNSRLFVFPSLSEGFGIPVLEAFYSQVPVITSNTTSLPEVAGNGALLVDPNDYEAIAQGIQDILSENDLESKLIQEGMRRVKNYLWKSSSKKMQKLIRDYF